MLVPQFPVHLVTGAVKTVADQGLGRARALYTNRGFYSPLVFLYFRCLEAVHVFLGNTLGLNDAYTRSVADFQ